MAVLNLAVVLEAVAQLDDRLTRALGHADVLAAYNPPALDALRGMQRSLVDAAAIVRGLGNRALRSATELTVTHSEIAVRDRTAAMLVQLAELRVVEAEAMDIEPALFAGRFRNVIDVAVFVVSRLTEINEARLNARLLAEELSGGLVAGRSPDAGNYRVALDRAEHEITDIGRDADLRDFLRAGSRVRSNRFRTSCQALALLLDVPVENARSMEEDHEHLA